MWPETIEVIRQVRPRYAFLENVRGLLSSGYFQEILKDLAESGYDARWRVLSAAELGAPHRRERLWIVAHTNGQYGVGGSESQQPVGRGWETRSESGGSSQDVADADSQRQPQPQGSVTQFGGWPGNSSPDVSDATIQGLEGQQRQKSKERGGNRPPNISWWKIEPDVDRVVDRLAFRVERLKAIGNGQVPAVVRAAWELLSGAYDE